jgi:outer membrane protein assembly factor BamB
MKRGEPVVIANGVVFGYGSGEETQQVFTDAPRIKFDSSIRAARGTHATIYALDAQTGKELWSSGDSIHQWNHFSGLTVANGRVYLGTYDGTLYCFGIE